MTPHEQVLHDRANELLMKGDRIGAAEAYEQLATEHERAELFLKAVATLKLAYGLDPRPSIASDRKDAERRDGRRSGPREREDRKRVTLNSWREPSPATPRPVRA